MDFEQVMDEGGLPITCPGPAIGEMIPPAPDRSAEPMIILADELDAGKTQQGEIRGNVELTRADQHIATERVLFHPVSQQS